MGLSFRNSHGFWRPFFLGIFVVALGMTANWSLAKLMNSPTSKPFSNYSYTLYGIASGNKGWEQAGIDHPTASESEILDLALQKIKENPALFAQGVIGAYSDYFVASKGAFSFLLLKHERNDIANLVLWILSFAGLVIVVVNRKQKIYSISFAFFVGIFLSVSLVPPADSTMMRAYAATIPMSCYLLAIGATFPQKFTQRNTELHQNADWAGLEIPFLLSAALLVASFILPVLIKLTGQPPMINSTISCKPDKKKIAFAVANGSSITLRDEKRNTYVPNLEFFRFSGKIVNPEQQLTEEEKSLILNMEPGTTITIIRALIDSNNPILSTHGFLITKGIPQPGAQTLCVDDPQLGVFYYTNPGDYKIKIPNALFNSQIGLVLQIFLKIGLWLTFIFILIKFIEINKFPTGKIPLVVINTALIASGLLLCMHNIGLVPLAWEQSKLDSSQFQHRDNFLYAFNIGNDLISDTNLWDFPAYLYEDGVLLSQPHESQSLIAKYGRGSYILKEKFLFFSTSDNSDPEANGRQYMLEFPMKIRTRYQIIVFVAALLSLLFHFLYLKPSLKKNNSQ